MKLLEIKKILKRQDKLFVYISLFFVLLNIFYIKNFFIGLISVLSLILLTGKSFSLLYRNRFINLEFPFLFGVFTSIFLLLFLCSTFILFYKITPEIIGACLIVMTAFSEFVLSKYNHKKELENISLLKEEKTIKYYKLKFSILIPIGIFLCSFFLVSSFVNFKFKDYIVNYFWKNYTFTNFIFIFSIIFFLIVLIFTEKNKKYILFFIVFSSFVIHSNEPIFFNKSNGGVGDRYRFLANEEILKKQKIVRPSLFGTKDDVTLKTIGKLKIPEVLIAGNKQSYINKWGLDIIFSYILNIDISKIDIWANYILWSLFIPFIFFNIFKLLLNNEKLSLLFSASSLILYTFQFNGSVSFPISVNFIIFLFFILLFISKIKQGIKIDKEKILLIGLITILLYFNYILFLFIWIVLLLSYFSYNLISKLKTKIFIKNILLITSTFIYSLLFLALDLVMRFATLNLNFKYFITNLKNFFINFLSPIFIPNVNISMPIFIRLAPLFSIVLFILIFIGVYYFYKENKSYRYILSFFISIFLSYLYCWTILGGDRIFSRKIGIVLLFFFLVFLVYGIYFIFIKLNNLNFNKKTFLLITLSLFISSIATIQYASGPVIEINMNYDLDSFIWVYDKVKNDKHPCIIGDTIHTIIFEYISHNKIVAGGFPQTGNYVQTDRTRIFNEMLKNPDIKYLKEAEKITGSENCIFVTDNRNVDHYHAGKNATETFVNRHKTFDQITNILGNNKPFREIMVFYKN